MTAPTRAQIAEVLAAHRRQGWVYICGDWGATSMKKAVMLEGHITHQAAEVERLLAETPGETVPVAPLRALVEQAALEVQRVINHWSSVPADVLAERAAELADLEALRDRIAALLPGEGSWCLCGVVDDRRDGTCGNCGLRIMTADMDGEGS